MKSTADSVESGQMTIQMTQQQQQQQQIGFQLPPPYSVQTSFPDYGPNSVFDGSMNGFNATLNLFNQTLGNNDKFVLAPMARLNFTTRTIIVQLRDTAQRPLMSIMTVPGQNISTGRNHDNSIRVGSVIQMTNTSGQTLLTAKENGQSITISSGEHVLGIVEGNLLWSTNLNVRGVMGDIIFQSIGGTGMNTSRSGGCFGATPSEFTLISNGVALARIEKSNNNSDGCVVSLLNSHNTDLRTKALLVFTGYLMFYAFLADTSFGKIGARGFTKRICLYFCIFFLVVMVLFVSIPIIVVTTQL